MSLTQELLEQYEYSLPIIKADKNIIRFEASRDTRAQINLTNTGGGILEGSVVSDLPALSMAPSQFTGNKAQISVKFSLAGYNPGDVLDARVIIVSNGGEIIIPVHITVISKTIVMDDGRTLSMLDDFLLYAEDSPKEAAALFPKKEFAEWLSAMPGDINMALYEHFKFDDIPERGVDNFLICHGLKEKTELYLKNEVSDITLAPGGMEPFTGCVYVGRAGRGYVRAELTANSEKPGFSLLTKELTAASFDKDDTAGIDYQIDPKQLKGGRDAVSIKIKTPESELTHKLFILSLPVIDVSLSKNTFELKDNGKIIVENNTELDLRVEIVPRHDFFTFEGRYYLIGARADIPFSLNLAPQKFAQLSEENAYFLESEILVKTIFMGNLITRAVKLNISTTKGIIA